MLWLQIKKPQSRPQLTLMTSRAWNGPSLFWRMPTLSRAVPIRIPAAYRWGAWNQLKKWVTAFPHSCFRAHFPCLVVALGPAKIGLHHADCWSSQNMAGAYPTKERHYRLQRQAVTVLERQQLPHVLCLTRNHAYRRTSKILTSVCQQQKNTVV